MTVHIRGATADDLPAVLDLYEQLYPGLPLPAGPRTEDAWAMTLATPQRTVLVAEVEGVVVGTADLTVLANTARAGRPYLLVENVVVDRAHHRRGVGTALMNAARGRAEAAGCYKLQLSADEVSACAFYESAGFRPSARTYKQYLATSESVRPPG